MKRMSYEEILAYQEKLKSKETIFTVVEKITQEDEGLIKPSKELNLFEELDEMDFLITYSDDEGSFEDEEEEEEYVI